MDKKTEIEAATFRRIIKHLQDNPEIQNIDLMNLANFVEIVSLNGMYQSLQSMILKYPMMKQESLSMV